MISFDDATTASNLPSGQLWAVFYTDGEFANETEVKARLPHAKAYAGITVLPRTGPANNFADCELGDLSVAQTEAWVVEQIGLDIRLLGVYANLSRWAGGLYDALAKYGLRIKRWAAAYDQEPSLTLTYQGRSFTFDAHQWAGGVSVPVDRNVADDGFFTPWKPPAKPSGIVNFKGSYNIDTDRYTIKKIKGTAKYAGPASTKEATVKIQIGKDATGPRVNIFRND